MWLFIPLEALFGTRVFEGIGGDNPHRDWVKPQPSPNPFKSPFSPNPLGRGSVLGIEKNALEFGDLWGNVGMKHVKYTRTKRCFGICGDLGI